MSALQRIALCCIIVMRHRDTSQDGAMPATQTYSMRLDADRRSKLEEIARRKDRDLSYVIRKAIDEYIERHEDDTNGG